MKKRVNRLYILTTLLLVSQYVFSQTTYLPQGSEDELVLDRIETKSGHLSNDMFTTLKYSSRKGLVKFLEAEKNKVDKSSIDKFNIDQTISHSGEWAESGDGSIDSKLPIFKTFYKKQPDLVHVNIKDFFLSVNPVIGLQGIADGDTAASVKISQTKGVEIRSLIAKRLGVYTFFTDNQEQIPKYVYDWVNKYQAVPGSDYYQTPNIKTLDYINARGYIDFAAIKNYVNVTFGYDKQFIGDGIRSLFLSDFSAPATFLKINTRIWRLNYQNLFMQLTPQYTRGADNILPHKYATMHHLSINATKWLNVGLFESTIFGRTGGYELNYLNPIILYRAIERTNGSPDNVLLGLNFKAIAAQHIQLYGQFLLDEFSFSNLSAGTGWWGNKFGVQLGGKYFDAFTVKNLDLQGEINYVRPFTYSHFDSVSNYSNYNQPLAHPLGANFAEFVGTIRYQPIRKLYLTIKGTIYKQGADSAGSNFGSNIFLDYNTKTPVLPANPNYGYTVGSGVLTHCVMLGINVSYAIKDNLFIDLGFNKRSYTSDAPIQVPNQSNTYIYGGLRLNLARRSYDFY